MQIILRRRNGLISRKSQSCEFKKARKHTDFRFGKAPAEKKNGEGFLPHFFIDSKISRIKMRTRINDSIWKLLSK